MATLPGQNNGGARRWYDKGNTFMNVAIAALSAPAQLNGVSRHAANLARSLLSQRDISSVHFLSGEWQRQMFPDLNEQSDSRLHVHWISLPYGNLNRLAWYLWELPHLLDKLGVEVVHLAYPAPVRSGWMPCPAVVTLHDLYPFDIPENFGLLRSVVTRRLMQQCLRNVSAVACVSTSTQLRLSHWFGGQALERSSVIPNAVEAKPAASRGPLEQLNRGAPFVLCVSQHRQNKNIPLTIRIFANALRDGLLSPATRLLIIGIAGPATAQIREQIHRSVVGANVHLLSGVSEPELQWCYRHCMLLLAPSRIEGFGLPIAEAMLAGCPIVCSDIAAFREVGSDQVRYVPFVDGLLAKYDLAIREVLLGPRPNPLSLPHLSPQVIGAKYLALYRSLTDHDRVRGAELRQSSRGQLIGS